LASYLQIHASYCALAFELETKRQKLEAEKSLSAPLALVGAMLAGFMHEFRGGFQSLSNMFFAIHEMADDPAFVESTCSRARKLLGHLVAVSRDMSTMADHKPACNEKVILSDLLERVFAPRKAIEVAVGHTDPGQAVIRGNPIQIEMAFRMLFDNSCEAMPKGGKVTVNSWVEGSHVKVSVADTGIGMDEQTRQRCWDMHFSTKCDSRGLPTGTGLGLQVVKGILSRHGGDVSVTSSLGHGTCFTTSFPIAEL
jgi:signal transduction histidine kinase